MELWRARPGDVIALPAFPGEVTVRDTGLGGRHHARRVEWGREDGMSGALDLGELTEVRLLATEDGVNAAWLSLPAPECRAHGRAAPILMEGTLFSMNDTAVASSGTCGHEFSLSGVGYRCERTPHPVDDGSNIPGAACRHAAMIDAGLAEGTEEHEGQGDADLITWGEDETGEGQDWDLAWGHLTDFTDRSHGAYQEKP